MLKFLKYFSTAIVFSLAVLILMNYYSINNDKELDTAQKYLKHFVIDHGFNDNGFGFIKLDLDHQNYLENGSGSEMNIAAATVLFLFSTYVILCFPDSFKLFTALNFLFNTGFKRPFYRPPENSL